MKNKSIIIFLYSLLFCFTVQAQNYFEKRIALHPNSYNLLKGITQFSNGNYMGCGYVLYARAINNQFSGVAVYYTLNSNGDTINTYEFYKNDTAYFHQFGLGDVCEFEHCITNSVDQVVAVAAIRGHGATNQYDSDILLVKINNQGDTILTKQISHPNDSALIPFYVIQTFDNNYLIAGELNSFYDNHRLGFVMKVDSSFNMLWRKSFTNPTKSQFFLRALEANDHAIFLSGSEFNNTLNIFDPLLVKIDSAGNELWRKNCISNGYDYGSSVVALLDGNYMFSSTLSIPPFPYDSSTYRFIKFDNNGNILLSSGNVFDFGISMFSFFEKNSR